MNKGAFVLAGLLGVGVLGLPAYVQAEGTGHVHGVVSAEKDVDFKDIPQVVQDAVTKASSAKVHEVVQYEVRGKLHYHVCVGGGADRKTLIVDEAGNILVTKDKITFDDLPGQVKDTMGKEAGSSPIESVEKAADQKGTTYYIGTTVDNKSGEYKVIRVGIDGKLISEANDEDAQLAGEKVVPQSQIVIRTDIKSETKKYDDLPGQVKTTIGALAKSSPIDPDVVHLMPGGTASDAYVATIGKDPATQKKIFVDAKGDSLDGAELDPYIQAPAVHHHHGG